MNQNEPVNDKSHFQLTLVSAQEYCVAIQLCYSCIIDVDECALGEAECHENATCSDVVGGENSYNCTCKPGFTGKGSSCVGKL